LFLVFCGLMTMSISVGNAPDKYSSFWLSVIRIMMGAVWLHAGYEKVKSPDFVNGIEQTLNKMLSGDVPVWFSSLFHNYILPNAHTAGTLLQWAEVTIGVLLILGFLVNIAAIGSIKLNAMFFILSGWMSAAGWTLNLLMIVIGVVLLFASGSKAVSCDKYFFRRHKFFRVIFLNKKTLY